MRVERRRTHDPDNRWPRCVIGSGVAHLVLLAACVLLQPVSENVRPILRVRLVEEARPPASAPIATDILRTPAPTQVPLLPRPRARRVPSQSTSPMSEPTIAPAPHVESLPASLPVPAVVQDPLAADTPSSAIPAEAPPAPPAPPTARLPESPLGPPGGNGSADVPGPSVPGNDGPAPQIGGGSGSSAPTQTTEAEPRGAYLLSGQGNGLGAGNGSGAGPGIGPGRGSGAGWGGWDGGGAGSAGGHAAPARGGDGAGSGAQKGEQLLRTIRSQIARVWTYPDAARRDGLEGTVWLRFRIAADGSVESVEVDRSSGHALLDDAAIKAVRRAGPYPPYGGPIRYPFTYRLDR